MDDDTAKAILILFLLAFLVVMIGFGPFFTIWSINHIFGTEIQMSFKTWCAVIWLMTFLKGINFTVKKQ
jgi:hypothetical protein